MIETPEVKNLTFEIALEKARRLSPLRQLREKFGFELGNLHFNLIPLQMAGKTLAGEKARIEGEIAKLNQDERDALRELRQFFASAVDDATRPVRGKIAEVMLKRLRLRDLLAESAMIYAAIEQVQGDYTGQLNALRKIAAELKDETKESYSLPDESPFPSTLLPSPTLQQINRARSQADNIAEILEAMANQIG
jgi:hypothetical protein